MRLMQLLRIFSAANSLPFSITYLRFVDADAFTLYTLAGMGLGERTLIMTFYKQLLFVIVSICHTHMCTASCLLCAFKKTCVN